MGRHSTDQNRHLDSKVDPIQTSLNKIHISLNTLGDQVGLLEERVGTNEDNLTDLTARIGQLETDNTYLMEKVEDLENRSRRSNLRFIGVPESAESGDLIGFMTRLIHQVLGQENFSSPLMIERAHRSPTVRQNPRDKPRPILIKLLNFQDKVRILRLAREKKQLEFQGSRIFIYPDFSAELTKKRRSFDSVKRKLRNLNMNYFIRYPSTLCVTVDGKLQHLTCHKRAEATFMSEPNSPEGMKY